MNEQQAAMKQLNKFVTRNLTVLCQNVLDLGKGKCMTPDWQLNHLVESLTKLGVGQHAELRLAQQMVADAAMQYIVNTSK